MFTAFKDIVPYIRELQGIATRFKAIADSQWSGHTVR